MRNAFPFLIALVLVFGLGAPAAAQQRSNDGFHRRNGQMHLLRNGQLRPMTRDSRLPTGVLVTKDGFLVRADGTRTELREGQACDLSGQVVAVQTATAGGLALGAPAAAARREDRDSPAVEQMRTALADVFGRGRQREETAGGDDERYEDNDDGKSGEKRRKAEEKWREYQQKRNEKNYERTKKWAGKRHKGKKWDD